jgi:hypothetical protein
MNMNIYGDRETLQQHRLQNSCSLWTVATMAYPPHPFHGIDPEDLRNTLRRTSLMQNRYWRAAITVVLAGG